jgi:hypothetical protein
VTRCRRPSPISWRRVSRTRWCSRTLRAGTCRGDQRAASLAIQAGANIKALQNMLGHESAGLGRYGHLYGSDVEAVGVAINNLLTRDCLQNVGTGADSGPSLLERNTA